LIVSRPQLETINRALGLLNLNNQFFFFPRVGPGDEMGIAKKRVLPVQHPKKRCRRDSSRRCGDAP
jgi:hypothetical protein